MSLKHATRLVADDIVFAYHDTGAPPNKPDYLTIIIIHGHTFHSATFLPMLEAAFSFGYRVIAPNRRLYAGSTPYTKEETDALGLSNSPEDRVGAYIKQGRYLLSFVDNMILEHDLKNVIVTGWSLGSAFLSAMVCSMASSNVDVQVRLRQYVKGLVWWDLPATTHGLPDPPSGGYIPLYDEKLTPELRGQAFVQWVTQYFPHPNLDKKDCTTLIYKNTTQAKPATYSRLPDSIFDVIDITAGPKGDDVLGGPSFRPTGQILWERTFLDAKTRKGWEGVPFSVIYGEETAWPVLWAVWQLEAQSEKAGLPINFKGIAGANHYPMHDNVTEIFQALSSCV